VKAFASLACRKGDGRFRSEADFSAFLPYARFGSKAAVESGAVEVRSAQYSRPARRFQPLRLRGHEPT
jgi:hypothetical protein